MVGPPSTATLIRQQPHMALNESNDPGYGREFITVSHQPFVSKELLIYGTKVKLGCALLAMNIKLNHRSRKGPE